MPTVWRTKVRIYNIIKRSYSWLFYEMHTLVNDEVVYGKPNVNRHQKSIFSKIYTSENYLSLKCDIWVSIHNSESVNVINWLGENSSTKMTQRLGTDKMFSFH